ncbi:MAG: 7-carboxy-7-deazaguanine synthase QueE [Pirellulaceae bacterium]
MRVVEIYKSMQGEGILTGTESVFLRTAGCNLRCWYCDTPYASWHPEGDDLSVAEIFERICETECRHVVVTGGEPMIYSELVPLCADLAASQRHITVETAGTLHLPLICDLMSVSPKLSNSTPSVERASKWRDRHDRTRNAPGVIRRLVAEFSCQFKFVIDRAEDCDEVLGYLEDFPEIDRTRVLLMPQGTDVETLEKTRQWLEPYCLQRGLAFCPRKQVEWYGMVRGT